MLNYNVDQGIVRCGRLNEDGSGNLAGRCSTCGIGEMYACNNFWIAPVGSELSVASITNWPTNSTECACHACWGENHIGKLRSFMHVCDQCGNKRCPRATDHRNECTGSNEPGQIGSIYGTIVLPPQTPEQTEMIEEAMKVKINDYDPNHMIGPGGNPVENVEEVASPLHDLIDAAFRHLSSRDANLICDYIEVYAETIQERTAVLQSDFERLSATAMAAAEQIDLLRDAFSTLVSIGHEQTGRKVNLTFDTREGSAAAVEAIMRLFAGEDLDVPKRTWAAPVVY